MRAPVAPIHARIGPSSDGANRRDVPKVRISDKWAAACQVPGRILIAVNEAPGVEKVNELIWIATRLLRKQLRDRADEAGRSALVRRTR